MLGEKEEKGGLKRILRGKISQSRTERLRGETENRRDRCEQRRKRKSRVGEGRETDREWGRNGGIKCRQETVQILW